MKNKIIKLKDELYDLNKKEYERLLAHFNQINMPLGWAHADKLSKIWHLVLDIDTLDLSLLSEQGNISFPENGVLVSNKDTGEIESLINHLKLVKAARTEKRTEFTKYTIEADLRDWDEIYGEIRPFSTYGIFENRFLVITHDFHIKFIKFDDYKESDGIALAAMDERRGVHSIFPLHGLENDLYSIDLKIGSMLQKGEIAPAERIANTLNRAVNSELFPIIDSNLAPVGFNAYKAPDFKGSPEEWRKAVAKLKKNWAGLADTYEHKPMFENREGYIAKFNEISNAVQLPTSLHDNPFYKVVGLDLIECNEDDKGAENIYSTSGLHRLVEEIYREINFVPYDRPEAEFNDSISIEYYDGEIKHLENITWDHYDFVTEIQSGYMEDMVDEDIFHELITSGIMKTSFFDVYSKIGRYFLLEDDEVLDFARENPSLVFNLVREDLRELGVCDEHVYESYDY